MSAKMSQKCVPIVVHTCMGEGFRLLLGVKIRNHTTDKKLMAKKGRKGYFHIPTNNERLS